MIHFSKSRKVPQWHLFTKSGKPVYNYGTRGHTLQKAPHGAIQSFTLDDPSTPFNQARLQRAEKQLGEPVEWRRGKDTEVMDVAF